MCDYCGNLQGFLIKVTASSPSGHAFVNEYACRTCYDEFAAQYVKNPATAMKLTRDSDGHGGEPASQNTGDSTQIQ